MGGDAFSRKELPTFLLLLLTLAKASKNFIVALVKIGSRVPRDDLVGHDVSDDAELLFVRYARRGDSVHSFPSVAR